MVRALILLLVAAAYVAPLHCTVQGWGLDTSQFQKRFLGDLFGSAKKLSNLVSSTILSPLTPSNTYTGTGNSGLSNKDSGWPLVAVTFDHPIQSPVDIVTSKAVTKDLPMLDIIAPATARNVPAIFYNSGHTVYVYIKEDPIFRPYLIGGPLKNKFIYEQTHFHWGSENIWGSEHFIDGESFAVEIHAVHYNSKYPSFADAAKEKDGLAVLTVFAEATSTDNPLLDPLYKLLPNVTTAKSSAVLNSNDAIEWFASALSTNTEYYTYPGSLTTATYSENVVFILLPKPITLSVKQLSAFRNIHDDNLECVVDNKRQLQPLHNRPIVRSTSLQ